MNDCYIIVPVFKRLDLTIKFVKSVVDNVPNVTVLIVDDSVDLENYNYFVDYKHVVTLKTPGDQWWCSTVNIGLDYLNKKICPAHDDIVIIANNDVYLEDNVWNKIRPFIKNNTLIHPRTLTTDDVEVSSGAKVLSWFPYITSHHIDDNHSEDRYRIDLCTARFLCMTSYTQKKIGLISDKLLQYQGDNDFSLRAKKIGINTYVLRDAYCKLYDLDTGLKSNNISTLSELFSSFNSIRSPNNFKYRYSFLRLHFGYLFSCLIIGSMSFNVFAKYIYRKIFKRW